MSKKIKFLVGLGLLVTLFFLACQKNEPKVRDTILTGSMTVHVDESVLPILEDQQAVFQSQYKGTLRLQPSSEREILQALTHKKASFAVLTRDLTQTERNQLIAQKISPKSTPFAYDALAVVSCRKGNDTIIYWKELHDLLSKGSSNRFKGIVFDNINSGTVRAIAEQVGVSADNPAFYSFTNHEEALKFISSHQDYLGVFGVNWFLQPPLHWESWMKQLQILHLENPDTHKPSYPSQDEIASGSYPLARHLYLINAQGYAGLGKGFAAFVAGERGQRIILKSGLVPEKFPSRQLVIRQQLLKKTEN
jgi:phosphate transport system substrate-binding protein